MKNKRLHGRQRRAERLLTRERSCGAIVFRKGDDGLDRVLLVQHKPGHWSFPKGHVEAGESDRQTAIREVEEETGALISITSDFQGISTYSPRPGAFKTVIFFLGDYLGGQIRPQLSEIKAVGWMTREEAEELLIFDRDLEIFLEALDFHKDRESLESGE